MGIFSDDDINEAERLIKSSRDSILSLPFLRGFEERWKQEKEGLTEMFRASKNDAHISMQDLA